jgi:rhamnogalacturonan hydrolase
MGSLGTGTDISDIVYRNVYTWNSNQMFMVKSNGGSGTVSNLVLENFIGMLGLIRAQRNADVLGHGNAYSLDIDAYWSSMSTIDGEGVELNNVTIRNWKGTEANGAQRGPIKVLCAAGAPCTEVTIEDFAMWTETGDEQTYRCENAFGSGFCLQDGDGSSPFTTTLTATAAPSGFSAPRMANNLESAFGTDSEIPVPTIPTSFFPGATPYSALAGANIIESADSSSSAAVLSTSVVSDARATQESSIDLSSTSIVKPTRVANAASSSSASAASHSPSASTGSVKPTGVPHGSSHHHQHHCHAH